MGFIFTSLVTSQVGYLFISYWLLRSCLFCALLISIFFPFGLPFSYKLTGVILLFILVTKFLSVTCITIIFKSTTCHFIMPCSERSINFKNSQYRLFFSWMIWVLQCLKIFFPSQGHNFSKVLLYTLLLICLKHIFVLCKEELYHFYMFITNYWGNIIE